MATDTPPVNMDEVSLYYDHYKDTFSLQKEYLAKRDRLTLLLLIAAIILTGLIFDPTEFNSKLNAIIDANIRELNFDMHFINTGVILVTFWYLLQYYLIVLQIEKMYDYIHTCEKRIADAIPDYPISREGASYLSPSPCLRKVANKFFVYGIPIGFIVLGISKLVNEWDWTSSLKYVDGIFLILIVVFSALYIINRKKS